MEQAEERPGARIRREVLGDEYVGRTRASGGPLMQRLEPFLIDHVWGGVWTRDGLDRRTRSMLTLAILAALGRTNEVALHTQGALRNGCSVDEIAEVLVHVAAYAGAPAAVAATRAATAALEGTAAE